MGSDCYCPIVFYCEWISYDLLISSHFSEMFVIMVIYAHKWHMYFCKHEEAFITIQPSIATIIIIRQIFADICRASMDYRRTNVSFQLFMMYSAFSLVSDQAQRGCQD